MNGIGKVAAGMAARRFEQRIQIGMTRTALARDARELGLGNADRFVDDGPIS